MTESHQKILTREAQATAIIELMSKRDALPKVLGEAIESAPCRRIDL